MPRLCSSLLLSLVIATSASAVTMDWVTVADPGNPGDPQESCYLCEPGMAFGSVSAAYRLSKYEVTYTQYAEFLNAVAASDPNGLYNIEMVTNPSRIRQHGIAGSYTYTVEGNGDWPIGSVGFYDVLRFVNWLNNGQPSGAQDTNTTENGAYAITAVGIANNSIARNPDAKIFRPRMNGTRRPTTTPSRRSISTTRPDPMLRSCAAHPAVVIRRTAGTSSTKSKTP
jgi:Sulfatase-modifying factor enzyme 1